MKDLIFCVTVFFNNDSPENYSFDSEDYCKSFLKLLKRKYPELKYKIITVSA